MRKYFGQKLPPPLFLFFSFFVARNPFREARGKTCPVYCDLLPPKANYYSEHNCLPRTGQ